METERKLAEARKNEALIGRVCRKSKKTRAGIAETADRILQDVRGVSEKLTDIQGNTNRFHTVCRMIESLEREKGNLDSLLVDCYHSDESFLQAMMQSLSWEGELTSRDREVGEIATATERMRRATLRLEEERRVCREMRDAYSALSRQILPTFLREVHRLSDADRNGQGIRVQSISVLCGELCNHITRLLKR